MRKEARGVGIRAAADIIDAVGRNPLAPELQGDEPREVAVGLGAIPHGHVPVGRGLFERIGHVFPDLERTDANVRPDGSDELGRVLTEGANRLVDDARHGAAPPRMHGGHVAARRMGEEHGHTVGRSDGDGRAGLHGDERIAFFVGQFRGGHTAVDTSHVGSMHLPKLEEPTGGHAELPHEAGPVLEHRIVVIAEVKPEVERVERSGTHPSVAGRKPMNEAVSVEQSGVECAHTRVLAWEGVIDAARPTLLDRIRGAGRFGSPP